jgi:hypothetical protein
LQSSPCRMSSGRPLRDRRMKSLGSLKWVIVLPLTLAAHQVWAQSPTRADCERACTASNEQVGAFSYEGRNASCVCVCKDGWARPQPHGACERSTGSWKKGLWTAELATANVLGRCVTTWKCGLPPGETIMRSQDSRLVATPNQNTRGACQMTDNPEECGRCVSEGEPATSCQYCVEPKECSNSTLGWRTRQTLGCCK